jgi:putative peptidoglycan lipid II flippase
MTAFVLSRILGLAREMIISSQFGTSSELGAYLAAFRIPDIIFQVVAGGALASAFIPTFASHLATNDELGGWRLASAIINLLLIILTGLALLGSVFTLPLVRYVVAPGFDPVQQELTANLMRYMLISTVLFGISGAIMGILNSYQHFLLPALAPAVYNLSIIMGALLLARKIGVYSLVLGVVVGAALHLIIQVPQLLRVGIRYSPYLGLENPSVREVGRLMLPRALGLGIVQLNFLVNTILASHLGAGSLAALNYAWMLMLLPEGIVAQGIATAAFPTFSRLVAQERHDEMQNLLSATLRAILYISIPASVGLFVLRVPLIQLLFQRGAFNVQSTDAVAAALQFYALGLFAHASVEIITRAFYAMHNTATPVMIGAGAMLTNIILSLLLVRTMNYPGLALANSVATIGEMLVLIYIIRRQTGGLGGRTMWLSAGRILVASTGMAWTAWRVKDLLNPQAIIVQVVGTIGIAGLVYVVLSAVLGSTEIRTLWSWIRNRVYASGS